MKVFLSLFLFSLGAQGSECSMRKILEENRSLLPTNQEVIEPVKGQGGFVNPYYVNETTTESDVIEHPAQRRSRILSGITPRPVEDVNQISQELKELMIREIAGSNNERSPAQDLMIKRIQDLNVVFKNCTGPEGSNDSTRFEVSLCTNTLKMPKLALVSLIAHELGHSLDLCGLGSKRYRKTNPTINLASLSSGSDHFNENLISMSDPERPYLLDTSFVRNPAELALFGAVAKDAGLEVADSGLPLSSNPLTHPYQCLSENDSHYRTLPEHREELCSGTLYTESGAQIWAARITGKYAETHAPSRMEALGLFANSMSGMNKGTTDKERDMDMIYFSDPNIRSMFGCSATPKQNCLNEFRPAEDRSLVASILSFSEFKGPTAQCE